MVAAFTPKEITPDMVLRAVGMNDEVTTCNQCGRAELRGTVIIADADNNEVGRYGTTCASKLVGYSLRAQNVRATEMVRRENVARLISRARQALADGAPGWALCEVRDARRNFVVHLATERAALAAVEADALALVPNGDAVAAVAQFVATMRTIRSIASGSGQTIGYGFDGATKIYPTTHAAYLALMEVAA